MGLTATVGAAPWTDPDYLAWEAERDRLASEDRHTRALAQAEAAGLTGLRNALLANA